MMVKELKRTILRIFFCVEVVVFAGVYIFGSQGIRLLLRVRKENVALEQELAVLGQEVQALEQDITTWNSHTFYKEKVAREQLQMVRAGEMVYYVTDRNNVNSKS